MPMVVNECDCVAIATALQAVDRFASEDDADHEKFVSKLDAESSCFILLQKLDMNFLHLT